MKKLEKYYYTPVVFIIKYHLKHEKVPVLEIYFFTRTIYILVMKCHLLCFYMSSKLINVYFQNMIT